MLTRLFHHPLVSLLLLAAVALSVTAIDIKTIDAPVPADVQLHRRSGSFVLKPSQNPIVSPVSPNGFRLDARRNQNGVFDSNGLLGVKSNILDVQATTTAKATTAGSAATDLFAASSNWTPVRITLTPSTGILSRLRNSLSRRVPTLPGWFRCHHENVTLELSVNAVLYRILNMFNGPEITAELSRSVLWRSFKMRSSSTVIFTHNERTCSLVTGYPGDRKGRITEFKQNTNDAALDLLSVLSSMFAQVVAATLGLTIADEAFVNLYYRRNRLGLGTIVYLPQLLKPDAVTAKEHPDGFMPPIRLLAERLLSNCPAQGANPAATTAPLLACKGLASIADAPDTLSSRQVLERVLAWAHQTPQAMAAADPLDARFRNALIYDQQLKQMPEFQTLLALRRQRAQAASSATATTITGRIALARLDRDMRWTRERVAKRLAATMLGGETMADKVDLAGIEELAASADDAMAKLSADRDRQNPSFRRFAKWLPF